jgi:hypothetical protein
MPTGELLQPATKHKLSNLRKGLRWRLTGEGAAWLLLAIVVAVLASLAVDYILRLEDLGFGAFSWACCWRGSRLSAGAK